MNKTKEIGKRVTEQRTETETENRKNRTENKTKTENGTDNDYGKEKMKNGVEKKYVFIYDAEKDDLIKKIEDIDFDFYDFPLVV